MHLHFVNYSASPHSFHATSPIPRLVVPTGTKAFAVVHGGDNELGLHVKCDHHAVASVRLTGEDDFGHVGIHNAIVALEGRDEGVATITAHQGHTVAHLHVHVFDPCDIHVNFYQVTDTTGATKQPLSIAKTLIEELNDIYVAQANVLFHMNLWLARDLRPLDFNSPLEDQTEENQFWTKLHHAVPAGEKGNQHWYVFLVKEWGGHDCDGHDAIGTNPIGTRYCVMEDKVGQGQHAGKVLAHEAGHMLGLHHNKHSTDNLMYPVVLGGTRLSWHQVEQVRHKFR